MSGALAERPRVLHSLPDRLRVHLPAWSGDGPAQVELRLRRLPGVRRVQANPLTGNVVIGFDPRTTSEGILLSALAPNGAPAEVPEEERPLPPVVVEEEEGTLRRAAIAVRGLDRDPRVARRVLDGLRRFLGVHATTSPLTGRVLVEYDEDRVDLRELLAKVAEVELPDLPGEDRPAHPLDRAPLLHGALRTLGAVLGLGWLALRRLVGLTEPPRGARSAALATGVLGLLRSFPVVRNGLRRLFGRHPTDLAFGLAGIVTLTFSRSPLGLALTGTQALLLWREVRHRRASWLGYEEALGGSAAAEPGAVIRLKPGETAPLAAHVIEGLGTVLGRDGLPRQLTPGAHLSAGARLVSGALCLQLEGGKPFLPQPRPAPLAPSLYSRYLGAVGPLALGYAAVMALFTRSLARTFEALLLVNPRPALIGMEAANLDAADRLLRAGVTVIGTRPKRAVRLPDVLLVDGPRVLTEGLEVGGVIPLAPGLDVADVLLLAGDVSTAAGRPWGDAFPRAADAPADGGSFNGLWASAPVRGRVYGLGPPEDDLPQVDLLLPEGGYLLALSDVEGDRPLGLVALRPRVSPAAGRLVQACRRLGVRLEMLPAGAPLAARGVARRAGVALADSDDPVAVIRERQREGALVAFLSDSAHAAPGFADCDLAIGLSWGQHNRFPARADLLAPDLARVAAVVEAGARRERAVRDAVGFSAAANVAGVLAGFQGRLGVAGASRAVYLAALAALADGWLRLRGRGRVVSDQGDRRNFTPPLGETGHSATGAGTP